MNKKELSEIRKNFSETSDLFVLNQVATAFVDSEKNIRCQTSRAYHNIPSEESDCLSIIAIRERLRIKLSNSDEIK